MASFDRPLFRALSIVKIVDDTWLQPHDGVIVHHSDAMRRGYMARIIFLGACEPKGFYCIACSQCWSQRSLKSTSVDILVQSLRKQKLVTSQGLWFNSPHDSSVDSSC